MKTVTKEEWDKTPKEYKKIYYGTPYMVYKDTDGNMCMSSVKILDKIKQHSKIAL